MKQYFRIISFFVVFSLVLSTVASAAVSWPALKSSGTDMPFRPSDKYVTDQNPPDFRWQYVEGAKSYELIVSKSDDLSSPVHKAENLTTNYYNFNYTFETGVNYWWAVRFTDKDGNVSDYSAPRRFRISPDAMEYTVPPVEELLSRIPDSHPRILTTPDTLDEIRTYKYRSDYSKKAYNGQINSANSYVNRLNAGTLTLNEPEYNPPVKEEDAAAYQQYQQSYRGKIQTTTSIAHNLGFAYLMSEDGENRKEEYAYWGKWAILAALKISYNKQGSSWVMDSSHPASFPGESSGQSFREITYKCAMAYDWLYDEFTSEEKATIHELLKLRTQKMLGVITNTEKDPHQSHGWTILGFLGIVGVATYNDIPEAKDWLTRIIPLYANMLPPWGYEDGGWSQGVDYWQWSSSTNQEFMNVLNLAGIINLYDKAWAQKEHLWSIYTYPYGSYGSFGDGAGINKAGSSSFGNIANTAYFTKNPIARWTVASYGDSFGTSVEDYYTGMLINEEAKEPFDYPLGHEFDDIGWAVMTDSLTDTDRVQLTFKSSPFGSYNHVAAEQNAFFIQAYGKILAGKSGYYDSYHSPHHATVSKATYAHNSITVDGAKGQGNANYNAKGDLTHFVTHMDFDSVTGDATYAYTGENRIGENATPETAQGELDKFIRSIIYIRPGVFVVIDDLDAKGEGTSSFEWWLNSPVGIDYTNNSANIKNGTACLDANVVYPQNTKATYYEGFINPVDGGHYPPGGTYAVREEHNRVCFATPKVDKTKIIVTMSVYEENDEAQTVNTEYASDGSYVRLTFGDGTVCVVNLGEISDEITDGTVTFKGVAATYNENSIMLTKGTSLKYDGSTIVTATYPMTIAIGHGELSMSINDDSNSGSNNTVTIRNNNKFISVASLESFKDKNGRTPSPETGFYPSRVTSSLIRLYPYKGNYNLYIDGTYVKPSDLVPQNVSISKSHEDYLVTWKEIQGVTYDIMVNNTVYEDVTSPYTLKTNTDDTLYSVALRGKSSALISEWSEMLYLSPGTEQTYSYVRYTDYGSKVTAEVFAPNFAKEDVRFVLTSYDGATGNTDSVFLTREKGIYSASINTYDTDGSYVKTYLWEGDNLKPVTPSAYMNSSNTNLKAIYLDGVAMEGFTNVKDEFTAEVSDMAFPGIYAVAEDNSAKVSVSHSYDDLCTYIKITSSNGNERTVKINYTLPQTDIHLISGATEESQYIYDTARSFDDNGNHSGKISKSVVGELSWNLVYPSTTGGESKVVPKTSNLYVYTNLMANLGGNKFASRLTSDRNPSVFNYTEFTNAPKEFWGYDHLLFPNVNFIDNFTKQTGYSSPRVEDASFSFTLEKSGEVSILSSGDIPCLEEQGFKKQALGKTSNGSYMVQKPGEEDVYYNIFLKGRPTTDLTSYSVSSSGNVTFGYLKNYDVLKDWIDVKPVSGYATVKAYADANVPESKFTLSGTLENLQQKNVYTYSNVYTKIYDIIEPTEITVDLGDYSGAANKMIVVVKPVTPKKSITNFKYLGALSFNDLSSEEREGCTDTYASKRVYSSYSKLPILRTFEEGAVAYVDNTAYTIDYINPLLELEGAYFVPPHRYLNVSETAGNWMKAYYYGMAESGGYSYPALKRQSKPLYSFDLNQSATLYVITYGNTPAFIDDTWQRVSLKEPAFTLSDAVYKYTDIYVKNVDVPKGESVNITMKTPATGTDEDGVYFLLVKTK